MGRIGELLKRLEERVELYQGESSSWEALGLRSWLLEHAKRWPELSVSELEELLEIRSIWVSDLGEEGVRVSSNETLANSPFLPLTEHSRPLEERAARLRGISPEGSLHLDSFGRPLPYLRGEVG